MPEAVLASLQERLCFLPEVTFTLILFPPNRSPLFRTVAAWQFILSSPKGRRRGEKSPEHKRGVGAVILLAANAREISPFACCAARCRNDDCYWAHCFRNTSASADKSGAGLLSGGEVADCANSENPIIALRFFRLLTLHSCPPAIDLPAPDDQNEKYIVINCSAFTDFRC